MAVQEMALPNQNNFSLSTRALGVIGMILSPMLFFGSLFYSQTDAPNPHQILASLGGVLYLTGAMATATAMRRLRVTGNGRGAFVLYVVQMIGLLLAMVFDVLEYAAPQLRESIIFFITDLAYPLSHVLMIVVGVAVLRARVWRGWRVWGAFLVGAALPSFIVLSMITGRETGGFIFPLLVTIGFFMLGLAVFKGSSERS